MPRLAALEAHDERDRLIASRPDFTSAQSASLRSESLATIRFAVKHYPGNTETADIARKSSVDRDLDRLVDARMGGGSSQNDGVRSEGNRLIFGSATHAQASRRLAEIEAAEAAEAFHSRAG